MNRYQFEDSISAYLDNELSIADRERLLGDQSLNLSRNQQALANLYPDLQSGDINQLGWVMDFSDIKSICKPVIETLDHSYLNDIQGLDNPTSENIAIWIWDKIILVLPNLCSVEVRETCNSGCVYSG